MEYDVVVIGAGPGGYVAAIRAAQLGLNTAVIEKRPALGGACLNVGCIPSKALLDSSEYYYLAGHRLIKHGIEVGPVSFDLAAMMARKQEVVGSTVAGIEYLFAKHGITRYLGKGSFVDPHTIKISSRKTEETIRARHVIIATGSTPASLPGVKIDRKRVITSTEALALKQVPKHLAIIGGGAIGLEIGSVYARLGAEVTVVESMPGIIPQMDAELGRTLRRHLEKQGFAFHLGAAVKEVKTKRGGALVLAEDKQGKQLELEGDRVLVAVGRRPFTEGLGLRAAAIQLDEQGRLRTNGNLRTAAPHIYAIGDVIAGPMLAHKAEEEGIAAAELIAGQKPELDYNTIPAVVYTYPEVAAVGRSEEQLKADGVAYNCGKFPFKASGRARAAAQTEGFVKVLADQETDEILGVHMIGPRCSDLIAEAVVAMEFHAAAEDIARIAHAHPSFAEPLKEAALAATGDRAIHI